MLSENIGFELDTQQLSYSILGRFRYTMERRSATALDEIEYFQHGCDQ